MASPDSMVANTKSQAFPDGPQLPLENFESYGGGSHDPNPLGDKYCSSSPDAQKSNQESYRSGLSKSAAATEGVMGR
jgi:hypothetical protein